MMIPLPQFHFPFLFPVSLSSFVLACSEFSFCNSLFLLPPLYSPVHFVLCTIPFQFHLSTSPVPLAPFLLLSSPYALPHSPSTLVFFYPLLNSPVPLSPSVLPFTLCTTMFFFLYLYSPVLLSSLSPFAILFSSCVPRTPRLVPASPFTILTPLILLPSCITRELNLYMIFNSFATFKFYFRESAKKKEAHPLVAGPLRPHPPPRA